MCGICAVFFRETEATAEHQKLLENINDSPLPRRGPDCQHFRKITCTNSTTSILYGATLHFRGSLTPQPLTDLEGNLLLWNGEIFGGIEVTPEENDAQVLLKLLSDCKTDQQILQVFAKLKGPWSFVYMKVSKKQLWFGRDVFGRRSLLCQAHTDGHFIISSIVLQPWTHWQEVPAVGIYCSSLDDQIMQSTRSMTLYPWASPGHHRDAVVHRNEAGIFNQTLMSAETLLENVEVSEGELRVIPPVSPFNDSVDMTSSAQDISEQSYRCLDDLASDDLRQLTKQLVSILQTAVQRRTDCQSHSCSRCIQQNLRHLQDKTIYESESGAKTLLDAFKSGQDSPNSEFTFGNDICDSEKPDSENLKELPQTLPNCSQSAEISQALHCTHSSDSTSTETVSPSQPVTGSLSLQAISSCRHSRVAVLFSGGVDSLTLAALADRCITLDEPIDLLNVAFQQIPKPQSGKGKQKGPTVREYDVPDRITGLEGLQQLQEINPHRKWNFVEINVTVEELKEARTGRVQDLLLPLQTVLDDSIGCAIWFAARGRGIIKNDSGASIPYTSPARVVLVGMGADEQFAGYSRHRVKFNSEGWPALIAEIKMEVERISSRNLGRDDRIISDHGRESRLPFLDEDFVSFVNSLPLAQKTNLHLPRGVGEKFLLRLAAESLGLKRGALAPKRAIQFGSRIAKVENRKEKGSDVCERLQNVTVSENR